MSAMLECPRTVAPPPPDRVTCGEFTARYERGDYDGRCVILLDGEVIDVPPPGPDHNISVTGTELDLREVFGRGYFIRLGVGLAVADDANSCPDIAVIRGKPRDFPDGDPVRAERVVEVANSTLAIDHKRKPVHYAASGTPEYWVIDVNNRRIHVFRDPAAGRYRTTTVLADTDRIAPKVFPESSIPVAELLP
jgi:Uma2 family endonuclease